MWNRSRSPSHSSRSSSALGARLPCAVSIADHPSGTHGPANRSRPLRNYGTDKPIEPQQLPLGRFHSFPVLPFKLKCHWNKYIFDPSRKSFGALCLIELKPWENDVFMRLYDNAGLMAGTQRFAVALLLLSRCIWMHLFLKQCGNKELNSAALLETAAWPQKAVRKREANSASSKMELVCLCSCPRVLPATSGSLVPPFAPGESLH